MDQGPDELLFGPPDVEADVDIQLDPEERNVGPSILSSCRAASARTMGQRVERAVA